MSLQVLKTVKRALDTLLLIQEQPLTSSEVAQELKIDRSSASRLLNTLVSYGFLKKEGKNYKIGLTVLSLAQSYLDFSELRAQYRDVLLELHDFSKETVYITEFNGRDLICVERINGVFPLHVEARVGGVTPLWIGATGKAFLSAYTNEDVARMAKRAASNEHVDIDRVLQELEVTRERGVAISHGEYNKGASGFSIPILDYEMRPWGAVTVVGATARFTEIRTAALVDKLLEIRQKIEWSRKEGTYGR